MNYLEFWQNNGLDYITPPDNENPEGFDVGATLRALITGSVLEIGCGTGRLAQHFAPDNYFGVDINKKAIAIARIRNPFHSFMTCPLGMPLPPRRETALLYTVALHIPDEMIHDQLARAGAAAPHIVIAEIMNPKFRENRDPKEVYSVSNQRSLARYCEIMNDIGFEYKSLIVRPYAHYKGEEITFASFRKKP